MGRSYWLDIKNVTQLHMLQIFFIPFLFAHLPQEMEVSAQSIVFLIGFIISIIFVVFPVSFRVKKHKIELNYAIVPVVIVVLLTVSTCIPIEVFVRGILGRYSPEWAADPTSTSSLVPLTVIILFLSLAYVCLSADSTGLFVYIATKFANLSVKSKNSDVIGLTCFYLFAGIFTLTTSNDIVVLTLTPVILEFIAKTRSKSLLPLLLAQFSAANTFSAGLLSGNPSNFILTSVFNIDFITYLKYLLLPSVISGLVVYVYSYILCASIRNKSLKHHRLMNSAEVHHEEIHVETPSITSNSDSGKDSEKKDNLNTEGEKEASPMSISPSGPIVFKSPELTLNAKVSSVILIIMFILFLLSSYFQSLWSGFEFWYIAVLVLVITLIKDLVFKWTTEPTLSIWKVVLRMPWKVPLFLFSMFILVEGTAYYGLIYDIASFLQQHIVQYLVDTNNLFLLLLFFIVLTCVACCIFNNLPATIVMSRILNESILYTSLGSYAQLVTYSIAAGTNFGACILPHCSLAGLMWSSMINNKAVLKKVWKHGSFLCLLLCVTCISIQLLQNVFY